MSLILAVEPDTHRAAQLSAMARAHLDAELILAPSVKQAFLALGSRVPDVLLTAPLLPPDEESALDDYLRLIGPAAAHVPALTIPLLTNADSASERGLLKTFRRDKSKEPDGEGCPPATFAAQISEYLRSAAARPRREAARDTVIREPKAQETVIDLSAMLDDDERAAAAAVPPAAVEKPEQWQSDWDSSRVWQVEPEAEAEPSAPALHLVPPPSPPEPVVMETPSAGPALPEPSVMSASALTPTPIDQIRAASTAARDPFAPAILPAFAPASPAFDAPPPPSVQPIEAAAPAVREALAPPRDPAPPVQRFELPVASPPVYQEQAPQLDPIELEFAPVLDAAEAPVLDPMDLSIPESDVVVAPLLEPVELESARRREHPVAPLLDPIDLSEPLTAAPVAPPRGRASARPIGYSLDPAPATPAPKRTPPPGVKAPPAPASMALAPIPAPVPAPATPTMVQQIVDVPTGNGTTVQTAVNVAVAVSVQVAASVNVVAPTQQKRRKAAPVQDEWGFFDPSQCGFQALVERLDEIASKDDEEK